MNLADVLPKLLEWWDYAAGSMHGKWCMLGFDKTITSANIRAHFDRQDLNTAFVERYVQQDLRKKQDHLSYGAEIDLVYGFSKAFAARHRTRLQLYADDWANKKVRNPSAVNYGYGAFKHMRLSGERLYNNKNQ